jgi:hypothetical protein
MREAERREAERREAEGNRREERGVNRGRQDELNYFLLSLRTYKDAM